MSSQARDGTIIHHADCLDVLPTLVDIDAVVTDPPYGLGFMGKRWDATGVAFCPETWRLVFDAMKPGAHLVAFGGTRTYHRMACAIEDAGFEIRDTLCWLYGSGFPKSHDVSKGIDKKRDDRDAILLVTVFMADAAEKAGISRAWVDAHMGTSDMGGWWLSRLRHRCQCPTWPQWIKLKSFLGLSDAMDAEVWRLNGRKGTPGEAWDDREVIGHRTDGAGNGSVVGLGSPRVMDIEFDITAPATPDAIRWQGWGTALKPAFEPIILARRPLIGTVVANVLQHGTGAINIDACRVATSDKLGGGGEKAETAGKFTNEGWRRPWMDDPEASEAFAAKVRANVAKAESLGRFPANVLHDGSEEVEAAFAAFGNAPGQQGDLVGHARGRPTKTCFGDMGPAVDHLKRADAGTASRFFYSAKANAKDRAGSKHPTVKPIALMRWLCRIVTPPGGTILDPFAGSGSTLQAAMEEGFNAIGIEREAEYYADICCRLKACKQ